MARKFFVDWTDIDYPEIRDFKFAPVSMANGEPWETPRTLAECKREIIEKCQSQIADAKAQIKYIRATRANDI